MYEQITRNKVKSVFLVLFFIVFVFMVVWAFEEVTGWGKGGFILALIISLATAVGGYYYSDKIVLTISRARPVTREEYPYLYHTVEGLAIAAGIPTPRCYVIDDTAPNAFATGRNPKNSVVCVTTGLIQKMNRLELEGVVAHEISHIKNYDVLLQTVAVVMVGVVALLSDWMLRSFWWGGGRRKSREERGGGNAGAILLLVGIILAILSPLIAELIHLAISRRREFLADASGAMLTRYPAGLASALKKIAADPEPLEVANKATAHLYIVNPLKNVGGKMNKLFSTHPPVEERIAALEKMSFEKV
ncbi:MAG: zinc metalloprotease HtpX [Candidatus Saccharicenans sp.]|nr:MAG: zinc metalloprotease HtpX [Candidatus Aminicenantes bacterium]HEK85208.1 zinc metalloprotease HtpX [Candidatus Aminicenantes bacterium]